MKKALLCILLLSFLVIPAHAADLEAPAAPSDVQELIPAQQESFGDALWYVVKSAVSAISPDISQAAQTCLFTIGAVLLVSMLHSFSGISKSVTELVGTVAVAVLLFSGTNALIHEGAETVTQLSEYGKLLLPVMAAALAAEGGISSSTAIYGATAIFDAVLCTLISSLLVPLIYVFLALSISNSAIGEEILKKLRDFVKWLVSWSLKTLLYIFTGYITISGVISGTTDQAALRATKLTISSMVPVVGGILSDASEAVLVGAGVVKNTAGIYGLLAVLAIVISPFLRIGVHYLLLKLTAAVCSVFAEKKTTDLIQDFSAGMGLLLAMTGTVCLLLIISTVCLMKGMG